VKRNWKIACTTPILVLFLTSPGAFAQQVLDEIVAVVGDRIILLSELNQYTYNVALQQGIDPSKAPDKFEEIRKKTLENLVDQKVLLLKAQEDSVQVEESQVDQVLNEQIQQMVQQLGSEEKLVEYFGAPLNKIKRDFRDDVRERLLIEALQAKKFREVKVSRREVEEFYHTMRDSLPEIQEAVKLSHILLEVKPGDEAKRAAYERIKDLLQRVRAGEDFPRLAEQYSEDPGSAANGGELGFIQRGEFVREFEEAAFALEPGQVSDIVETKFGYHIIKLLERRGEKINTAHILIRVQTTSEDEKRTLQRAEEIRQQILEGSADFAEMAKKYSDDKTTAAEGGSLGWFPVDQLQIAEFKKAVQDLKVGQVSSPLRTKFGYHVIKLDDKKEARKLALLQDWEQIETWALNFKRQKEFQKWLEDAKKDIHIDVKTDI